MPLTTQNNKYTVDYSEEDIKQSILNKLIEFYFKENKNDLLVKLELFIQENYQHDLST
jgi:hypothetical protein